MKNEVASSIDAKAIASLRSRLKGTLLQPDDEQYTQASQGWNLYAKQHPALVVMAANADDIVAAVQFAAEANMGVGVMATGHGVCISCVEGMLINTSKMRGVTIDPVAQTATVEPGAQWKDVVPVALEHGLAGLVGSAPHVGVVGYTMGGGFGFLGCKYGLNSASVTAADMVTANGKLVRVSPNENAELFWGLKGGAGNFGIITSLEFKLYPLTNVYGGAVIYPIETAREALSLYDQWSANAPDEITSAITLMNIPPLPFLPEVLRGRSVVMIKGCYCGENPVQGEDLFKPVRSKLGEPIMDTFHVMPVNEMHTINNDPVDPLGVMGYGSLLSGLSAAAIDALVKTAGAGSGSPLVIVELRRLAGALQPDAQNIKLLGDGNAQFSMNAIGATATPELTEKVKTHLALLANTMQPFETGETFSNFLDAASEPGRVRACYTEKDWGRLVALKTQYDPKNIFRFNRNIPPKQASMN